MFWWFGRFSVWLECWRFCSIWWNVLDVELLLIGLVCLCSWCGCIWLVLCCCWGCWFWCCVGVVGIGCVLWFSWGSVLGIWGWWWRCRLLLWYWWLLGLGIVVEWFSVGIFVWLVWLLLLLWWIWSFGCLVLWICVIFLILVCGFGLGWIVVL